MDKIRIYIALLFCQAISFILPVQAQDNTGSDSNWYNPYGGLMANSTNGRWHVMDPLCEKYYDVSPYAYCAGDPVNAIDPDGKSIWTKMLKTTMKIGSRVASNGLRELGKAATYAEAVSDIKELVKYEKTKFKLM